MAVPASREQNEVSAEVGADNQNDNELDNLVVEIEANPGEDNTN